MYLKNVFIIIIIFIIMVGCSSSEQMVSKVIEKLIVVDGNQEDWNGKLKFIEKEKVAVGFQNDSENLYFCFVTSNKSNAMKILSMGLTVWFKPGGNEQVLGLQYPQSMNRVAPQKLMGKNRNQDGNTDFEMTINAMMQNQGEFLLIDEDNVIIYASPIGSNDGYEMKIGAINQQFVYEAKIPIGNNALAPMPINIFPQESVTVEFETSEIDLEEIKKGGGMNSDMDQGAGGMYGAGQGGMRDGAMRGAHAGSNRMGLERLNFSINLKLAN